MAQVIVAFTGHRPQKWPHSERAWASQCVEQRLRDKLISLRPDTAISGMALGVDMWAAAVCVNLGIPLVAAVPCDKQDFRWSQEHRDEYRRLLARADEVHIISPGPYAPWKMHVRNKWMVDNCGTLIAVWDGTEGGTGGTVDYARSVKRRIERLNPNDWSWS